jgi:hypothetical protein
LLSSAGAVASAGVKTAFSPIKACGAAMSSASKALVGSSTRKKGGAKQSEAVAAAGTGLSGEGSADVGADVEAGAESTRSRSSSQVKMPYVEVEMDALHTKRRTQTTKKRGSVVPDLARPAWVDLHGQPGVKLLFESMYASSATLRVRVRTDNMIEDVDWDDVTVGYADIRLPEAGPDRDDGNELVGWHALSAGSGRVGQDDAAVRIGLQWIRGAAMSMLTADDDLKEELTPLPSSMRARKRLTVPSALWRSQCPVRTDGVALCALQVRGRRLRSGRGCWQELTAPLTAGRRCGRASIR